MIWPNSNCRIAEPIREIEPISEDGHVDVASQMMNETFRRVPVDRAKEDQSNAPASAAPARIFISYSHADTEWLERIKRHLKPLTRGGILECWDDTHIQPGDDWKHEIRTALDKAQVAILLISADFFASNFIDENELPPLLAAAQENGVRILPVIVSASRFARSDRLARFQAVNSPSRPLNGMQPPEQEKVLDHLAEIIESALKNPFTDLPYPGLRAFKPDEAPIFYGRGQETDSLIDRLRDRDRHFIAIVGDSGTGKSSLVYAGLLPRLAANAIEGSAAWTVVDCKPGYLDDDPFLALADALLRRVPLTLPELDRPKDLAERLQKKPGVNNRARS